MRPSSAVLAAVGVAALMLVSGSAPVAAAPTSGSTPPTPCGALAAETLARTAG